MFLYRLENQFWEHHVWENEKIFVETHKKLVFSTSAKNLWLEVRKKIINLLVFLNKISRKMFLCITGSNLFRECLPKIFA